MPKLQDIKVLTGASMNLDVDDKVLANNQFREIYNMIFDKMAGHYYPGNLLVTNSHLPSPTTYTNKFLGGCKDVKRNAFIIAIYSYEFQPPPGEIPEYKHGFYWYFPETKTFQKIFVDAILNFQADHPMLSMLVVGDLLYWTDGYEDTGHEFEIGHYNPPRKINLTKASNYTTKPYYGKNVTWWSYYSSGYTGIHGNVHGDFVLFNLPTYSNVVRIYEAKVDMPPWPPYAPPEPTGSTGSNAYWKYIETYDVRSSYLQPIDARTLDRIKYPPVYAPHLLDNEYAAVVVPQGGTVAIQFKDGYSSDINFDGNNLKRKSFQFSYRYFYDDNEVSVWSPASVVPHSSGDELTSGTFVLDPKINNVIGISINTGPEEVKKIEIAVKESEFGNWKIVDRLYKYDENGIINCQIPSDKIHSYLFYNNVLGEGIDQTDIFRIYDYVPQICKNTELIEENRLFDADIIEGYDNINIDASLNFIYDYLSNIRVSDDISTIYHPEDGGSVTIIINSPIKVGYIYKIVLWEALRLTVPDDGTPIITPTEYGDPLHTGCTTKIFSHLGTTSDTVDSLLLEIEDWISRDHRPCWISGNTVTFILDRFITRWIPHFIHDGWGWSYGNVDYWYRVYDCVATMDACNVSVQAWKSGALLSFGIQYEDRAGRKGAVLTNESLNLWVPTPNQAWLNGVLGFNEDIVKMIIAWTIRHKPPKFATAYQWMVTKPDILWCLDVCVSCDYIHTDSRIKPRVTINVNHFIKEITDYYQLTRLQYYEWQKGDRIRLRSKKWVPNGGVFVYLEGNLDFEIVGVEYPDDDSRFLTDIDLIEDPSNTNWAFILDDHGNKTLDPSKMSLVLESFDMGSYIAMTDTDPIVEGVQVGMVEQLLVAEIYRPVKEIADNANKWFYEFSEKFPIINPNTDHAYHGKGHTAVVDVDLPIQDQTVAQPATGQFTGGNIFIHSRAGIIDTYMVEDFNFSDFYKSDMPDEGKVGLIDPNMRRQHLITGMRFGGKYLENTQVNNLSTFLWADLDTLPEKYGAITKIKEIGFTLRVKQFQKMTSIYIGRAGLQQALADGKNIVVSSTQVLGPHDQSEDNWGLSTPQAYCENGKSEYFVDIINGVIVRNASNGPFPISEYGIKQWTKDKCEYLLNTCSQYYIFAGYDGYHDYVLFTFVGKIPGNRNPGDQWDVNTVVFDERENTWKCFLDLDINGIAHEGFLHNGMELLSFYAGQLYSHNDGDPLEFYGTKREPSIVLVANKEPFLTKLWKSIAIYSSKVWYAKDYGDINIAASVNFARGMTSKLPSEQFESVEGIHRAGFLANATSTSTKENVTDLVNGQELRGETMEIKLTCDERDEDVTISGIIIDALHSKPSAQ